MIEYQLDFIEGEADEVDARSFFSDSDIERGEVFTRREVVDFILDLTKWTVESGLSQARLLEPSAGSGDFVIPAVERLLLSQDWQLDDLASRVRAVEVNLASLAECRRRLDELLATHQFSSREREKLLDTWLIHGDFLTCELDGHFTHVIGNPPYVRQEALPNALLQLYRSRFETMYDRADLYVPFFERGLSLLSMEGKLGFICADRWMKNKYGGLLRKLISKNYHLDCYVDFTGCPAFHNEVVAYPAVTIIRRGTGTDTRTARRPQIDSKALESLARKLLTKGSSQAAGRVVEVVSGDAPWLLENPARLNVIRALEATLPKIEEAGCQVGIGVATGIDKIYIRSDDDLPVEDERKLPLAMTRDIVNGEIVWGGKMLLNPFDGDSPKLVDPNQFPKFKAYIEEHRESISKRHVAKKNPTNWFKTIDRIYPTLTKTPKLLIPDIKGEASVVYDSGEFYPHHNFYYLTSNEWDLHALQAVLLSSVTQAFIATYSLKMRGDCLRYQAQYLRRIRLPLWSGISAKMRSQLISAGQSRCPSRIESVVQEFYGLSDSDWNILKSE